MTPRLCATCGHISIAHIQSRRECRATVYEQYAQSDALKYSYPCDCTEYVPAERISGE